MKDDKTGGPAFPFKHKNGLHVDVYPGMDLRDWFAGHALAAIIGGIQDKITLGPDEPNDNGKVARVAYAIADAMLAERNK